MKQIGCIFPNVIHPKAVVEESVIMGEGNVILAMANIGSCVKMGNLNYINNNSLISHDCELQGENVTSCISTGFLLKTALYSLLF